MDLVAVLLAAAALLVSSSGLVLAIRELRAARGQLDAAHRSNELSEAAMVRDTRRRNVDALVDLLEALRVFGTAAAEKQIGKRAEPIGAEQARVLLAIARAAPCLPTEAEIQLQVVITSGPEMFTQAAARDASQIVLKALSDESGIDWLTDPPPAPEVILAYLTATP